MLVQVSPWESSQTSVRRAETTPAKRRRRSASDASLSSNTNEVTSVVASFVAGSSRRAHKKKLAQNNDGVPVLVLTSGHRITVIGRSKDGSYSESSVLQYASRPGDASSFFPTKKNGSSNSDLPSIPAVLEYKNDRVYALQNGNKRLCCWNAFTDGGPDEKGALKVDLRLPAVSLSLLGAQRGIVYGSCNDGSLFVARILKDSPKGGLRLTVEYVSSKTVKGAKHVGTVAQIQDDGSKTQSTGRKRKNSDINIGASVMVYQAFHNDSSLFLVRHQLVVHEDSFSHEGYQSKDLHHSSKDIMIDLGTSEGEVIGQMIFSPVVSGSLDTLPVSYSVQKKQRNGGAHDAKYLLAIIDLTTGKLVRHPASLPEGTKSIVPVSNDIVAAAVNNEIRLLDPTSGATMARKDLPATDSEGSSSFQLYADHKSSSIAIVEKSNESIKSHFCKIQTDGKIPTDSSEAKLSSSLKLASCLAVDAVDLPSENAFHVTKSLLPDQGVEDIIQSSLDTLAKFRAQAFSKTASSKDHFFLKSYEKVVDSMLQAIHKVEESNKKDQKSGEGSRKNARSSAGGRKEKQVESINPLKAIERKLRLSGMHRSSTLTQRGSSSHSSSLLPKSFVEGASLLAIDMIESGEKSSLSSAKLSAAKNDAVAVLRQLLLTGKIEASVFPANLATFLGNIDKLDSDRLPKYSSFEFSLSVMKYCSKVSEKQMVTFLSNAMTKSRPSRIAYCLAEDKMENTKTKEDMTKFLQSKASDTISHKGQSLKVVAAGIESILKRMTTLSECNETMLRDALLSTVKKPEEAAILASSLSMLLSSHTKKRSSSVNRTRVISQWISALCDAFAEELSEAKVSRTESALSSLSKAVARGVSHSEAIMSLQEDLTRISILKYQQRATSNEEETEVVVNLLDEPRRRDQEIPGYSIETLIF